MKFNPRLPKIEGSVHTHYLREAYRFAWNNSDDYATQVGAIIVNPSLSEIISYGTNHFPEEIEVTKAQMRDKKWRALNIMHAEPSAIYEAHSKGISLKNAVMYMPWVPCTPCAEAIIDSGIKKLISHKQMILKTPKHWHKSTLEGINLLKKNGIEHFMYDGKIGDVQNMIYFEEWRP